MRRGEKRRGEERRAEEMSVSVSVRAERIAHDVGYVTLQHKVWRGEVRDEERVPKSRLRWKVISDNNPRSVLRGVSPR